MAAIHHLKLEFCHSAPPTKSTMRFDYSLKIWCRSDICYQKYCEYMILPLWLENTPFWWGEIRGVELLNIVGRHQPPKRYILG